MGTRNLQPPVTTYYEVNLGRLTLPYNVEGGAAGRHLNGPVEAAVTAYLGPHAFISLDGYAPHQSLGSTFSTRMAGFYPDGKAVYHVYNVFHTYVATVTITPENPKNPEAISITVTHDTEAASRTKRK